MNADRKAKAEEVSSFFRSGYCGDYRQREEGAEVIEELLAEVDRLTAERDALEAKVAQLQEKLAREGA